MPVASTDWITLGVAAVLLVACGGCSRAEPPPGSDSARATPAVSASLTRPPAARGVRIVRAPAGDDVAAIMREARERGRAEGRDTVLYVGARWCEPCLRFHKAAEAGELDGDFPLLTLLEFDLDVDAERLTRAGYRSQYIPLFVVPGEDGRATAKRAEGSVKGEAAVRNITPRLRGLLERPQAR